MRGTVSVEMSEINVNHYPTALIAQPVCDQGQPDSPILLKVSKKSSAAPYVMCE